jgi:hypothetical protein
VKLTDLDARFLANYRTEDGRICYDEHPTLDGAQGVMFQCPKCAEGKERGEEDGRRFVRGAHMVLCWFSTPVKASPVPSDAHPLPGRWHPSGTGLHDLTFVGPGNVSVLLTGGCGWHGHVRNGEATLT